MFCELLGFWFLGWAQDLSYYASYLETDLVITNFFNTDLPVVGHGITDLSLVLSLLFAIFNCQLSIVHCPSTPKLTQLHLSRDAKHNKINPINPLPHPLIL